MSRAQALHHLTSLVISTGPRDAETWEALHVLLAKDFPAAAAEAEKAASLISVSEKHQMKFHQLLEETGR